MTYQPQPYQQDPYQPPVAPGTPQSPTGWLPPPPPPPAKSRAVPLLIGALVVAVLAIGALGIAFVARPGSKSPTAPASQAAALTQAGAQRACRTAFGEEFKARMDANVQKDIVVATQGIDLAETWRSGVGYKVNGTVRYSLTTFPLDPVQDTLDLTCTVTGTDEAPVTAVDNRN